MFPSVAMSTTEDVAAPALDTGDPDAATAFPTTIAILLDGFETELKTVNGTNFCHCNSPSTFQIFSTLRNELVVTRTTHSFPLWLSPKSAVLST